MSVEMTLSRTGRKSSRCPQILKTLHPERPDVSYTIGYEVAWYVHDYLFVSSLSLFNHLLRALGGFSSCTVSTVLGSVQYGFDSIVVGGLHVELLIG